MNKRQTIILWIAGVLVSEFFIIQPVFIIPILIIGSLFFWTFRDIKTPLTKEFVFLQSLF